MNRSIAKFLRISVFAALAFGITFPSAAQDKSKQEPVELEALKASVGVWDAEIEVWPQGKDAESIKFKGVETNRAYGKYWIASDFDSEYQGQVMKIHSIVGYDLEKKMMVGKIIDHGPYAAAMTGKYDQETKTFHWITKVKSPSGKPIVQKTTVKQKSADERALTLSVPDKETDKFVEFMRIKFTKQK